MNHLDLFSGIGGFALAAQWVWSNDHYIHSFVEIEPFCQKVLQRHWPNVPIISDIRSYKHDGTAIDLLTGGFPCQPFSAAGQRRGAEDDRYLWPEMLRVIREVHPRWIIAENVYGIVNIDKGLVLETVFVDLESAGYQVQPFVVPACAVNAPHRRDRIWIVAQDIKNSINSRDRRWCYGDKRGGKCSLQAQGSNCHTPDTPSTRSEVGLSGQDNGQEGITGKPDSCSQEPNGWQESWYEVATRLCRVDDGIPNRVDRLKSLGNAIVPQVVVPIMRAIKNTGGEG